MNFVKNAVDNSLLSVGNVTPGLMKKAMGLEGKKLFYNN
jgi:hypothetical protein